MKKKASQALKLALSLILAAALLYFAFRGIEWNEFLTGLKTTNWWYILLSLAAAFAALVFRAERWRGMLVAIDPEVERFKIWHGSNIGNFLSLIIPGIGEFYRCAHVANKKSGYDRTFGTIIMERAWDVLAIFLLLLGAIISNTDVLLPFIRENLMKPFMERFSLSLWWIVLLAVLLLAAAVYLVFALREKSRFCAKCADAVKGILDGIKAFRHMPMKWLFLLYTAGIWVMYILMTLFTFKAVPGLQDLGFGDALFVSAVGNIASVIPTPGNLGAYHYIVGLAISSIYLGSTEILATPLLFATLSHGSHAALLIVLAIFSYVAITLRRNRGKK